MRRFSAEDLQRETESPYQPAYPEIGKILVVACLHGDEPFGLEVRDMVESDAYLNRHVDTTVGNTRAVRQNVRQIKDENMNRAFRNPSPSTYVGRQASRVLGIAEQYEYVFDIHQGRLPTINQTIIAAELNDETKQMVNVLDGNNVAVFAPNIAVQGLIGNLRRGRVSLEYSRRDEDLDEALKELDLAFRLLVNGRQLTPKPRDVFEVDQMCPRSVDIDPDVDYNFKMLPDQRGYGILFNDPTYANEPYYGFVAPYDYRVSV